MLSDQQKAHFEAFGFVILRNVFSADEMATIKRESDEIFSEGLGNTLPHGRVALQPFFEHGPFMSTLVADDRIYGIGESLLGPEFFLCLTEGNLHVGDTFWHGGGMWEEEVKSVKITFYPEALTAATGSLRVVPGSHRRGSPDLFEPLRHGNRDPDFRPFGMLQSDIPSVALETGLGDLAVFTEETLHAAYGGHDGRHQHAISFTENPTTESKKQDLREFYEVSRYSLRPAESYVNSDDPRIRRLVATNLAMGFDIAKGI